MSHCTRRDSMDALYMNLHSNANPYAELEYAAELFPISEEHDDAQEIHGTPSTTLSVLSSGSSLCLASDDSGSDNDLDAESNVESVDMNDAGCIDVALIHDDAPYIPRRTPEIFAPVFEFSIPSKYRPPVVPISQTRPVKRARSHISDEQSETDSTGDASDDEYIPSPRLQAKKRSRSRSSSSSKLSSRRPSPSFTASPAASSSSSERPVKRQRLPPPSRNRQASSAEMRRVESSDEFSDFICGVCGWVQANQRLPDFKRHLKTHQRVNDEGAGRGGWRCKGVLLEEASAFGLDHDTSAYTFLDKQRVGGCMKTFSRRDALKRHLDNSNVSCVGRPTPPEQD